MSGPLVSRVRDTCPLLSAFLQPLPPCRAPPTGTALVSLTVGVQVSDGEEVGGAGFPLGELLSGTLVPVAKAFYSPMAHAGLPVRITQVLCIFLHYPAQP